MKKTKIIIASIAIASVITGCGMSSMSYKNGDVQIQLDKNHFQISGTTLMKNSSNYGKLFLNQRVLRLADNSLVVYENARTDDMYEFNMEAVPTIKAVFDARDVRVVYFKSSFYLMQLILDDGRVLNLAADHFDDQVLSFIYGMSNAQMRRMAGQFEPGAKIDLISPVVTFHSAKRAIISRWNSQKINFIPLITPVRYLFGL